MPHEFKHILVPIDFSDSSERIVKTALAVFGEQAEKVTVMTVSESGTQRHTEMLPEIGDMIAKSLDDQMVAFFTPFKDKHPNIQAIIKKGGPSSQILKVVDEIDVDLIVMGSQGKNAFARVFFGSTTYDVARKAPCSVFVIRK